MSNDFYGISLCIKKLFCSLKIKHRVMRVPKINHGLNYPH